MVAEIVSLRGLSANARVLEVGCGCARLARAFAGYLRPEGRYDGFDVAQVLIEWCRQQLEPQLSKLSFFVRRCLRARSQSGRHRWSDGLSLPLR
jgi:ubiquinone/menaquinone biosynthesis C-methylase UbiE